MNTARACMVFQLAHQTPTGSRTLCTRLDHDRTFHRMRVPRSRPELSVCRKTDNGTINGCNQERVSVAPLLLNESNQACRRAFLVRKGDDRRPYECVPQFADPGAITRFNFSNGRFRVHDRQLPSRAGSRKIETAEERLVVLTGRKLWWPAIATFFLRPLLHARIDTGTWLGHSRMQKGGAEEAESTGEYWPRGQRTVSRDHDVRYQDRC